jgi:starch synthase
MGIVFTPYTPAALLESVEAAIGLYGEPRALARVRRNAMAKDFSWEVSARKYLQLYRQANASRRMGTGFHKWLDTVQETGPPRA